MSDPAVQPVADQAPGLSQMQRVTNVFTAPSKTFADIKRGNKSWWMPFIICGSLRLHFVRALYRAKSGWYRWCKTRSI